MPGWETLFAALGGLALGAGVAAWIGSRRARRSARSTLAIEARLRRVVVPVLERRADALGIPPSERGANVASPIELAVTLASAIGAMEESAELPFGDTVEVSRRELDRELGAGKDA